MYSILYFEQEAAWFCADEAVQILGGMGYMRVKHLNFIYTNIRFQNITTKLLQIFQIANYASSSPLL